MSLSLRSTGPDEDYHFSGPRVEQLLNEYCCTNFVKARADPLGHKALMAQTQFTPDPLGVAVSSTKLCPSQLHASLQGMAHNEAILLNCCLQSFMHSACSTHILSLYSLKLVYACSFMQVCCKPFAKSQLFMWQHCKVSHRKRTCNISFGCMCVCIAVQACMYVAHCLTVKLFRPVIEERTAPGSTP